VQSDTGRKFTRGDSVGRDKSDSQLEAESRAILSAYAELRKQFEHPAGSSLEELQAGTEYLLDKLKDARKHGVRLVPAVKSAIPRR
jgi:hypothetical protein